MEEGKITNQTQAHHHLLLEMGLGYWQQLNGAISVDVYGLPSQKHKRWDESQQMKPKPYSMLVLCRNQLAMLSSSGLSARKRLFLEIWC